MKKVVSILCILVIVIGLSSAFIACKSVPREETLKVYLPGEYIDEEIVEDFTAWYLEQTGENIVVELDTFDAVENIQLALEGGNADYDIVCPSDYMVEYLIAHDLIKEIDKEIINVEAEGLFKDEYLTVAREYDPQLKFSVPYMYGTLGLVYDYSKTGKHLTSWEDYFGSEFDGKATKSLKKSMRDAYAAACIYDNSKKTGDDKKSIQAVFEDTSTETINAAKTILQSIVSGNAVWDVDNVKYEMAANSSTVKVALMWSCDAGYVMNDYEDEDGNEQEGNRNLWYIVPDEGGNVYMDNFCITKNVVNEKAANYFLKYLCEKDVAVANSEYAGAISPVAAAYDELYDGYVEDEDGMFEGVSDEWKDMFLETMFPSAATLSRCGVMKDIKTGKDDLIQMWAGLL
ncbi:MAG: extracellular solute-binding protein [Clostridia bacterium]|nr:extracellular solute-binding protein [Clostridia bacterium]